MRNAQLAQETQGVAGVSGGTMQTQPPAAWHEALSVWLQLLNPMSSGPQVLVQDVLAVPAGQLAWSVSPAGQMAVPPDPASGMGPSPVSLTPQALARAAIRNAARLLPRMMQKVLMSHTASENRSNPGPIAGPWQKLLLSVLAAQDSAQIYTRLGDDLGFLQAVVLVSATPHAVGGETIGKAHATGQGRAAFRFGLAQAAAAMQIVARMRIRRADPHGRCARRDQEEARLASRDTALATAGWRVGSYIVAVAANMPGCRTEVGGCATYAVAFAVGVTGK